MAEEVQHAAVQKIGLDQLLLHLLLEGFGQVFDELPYYLKGHVMRDAGYLQDEYRFGIYLLFD